MQLSELYGAEIELKQLENEINKINSLNAQLRQECDEHVNKHSDLQAKVNILENATKE